MSTEVKLEEEKQTPIREVDSSEDIDPEKRYVGSCKWFNVLKGFGFINPDGMSLDCFVHQSELKMEGFRSLGDGERVSFRLRPNNKGRGGWEAFEVGPEAEGEALHGSEIRPLGKKKKELIRCFKCGRYGHHMAAKCKVLIPSGSKSCYKCGAIDHLFENCPLVQKTKRTTKSSIGEADQHESASVE